MYLCIVLVLLLAGGTQASSGFVRATHGDVAMPYDEVDAVSVCFVDTGGGGFYTDEDSVILTFQSTCSGTSGSNDIRLVEWAGQSAGERLGSAPDRGLPLETLSPVPRFVYHDHDNDNRLTPGDTVYLRMHNADQDRTRPVDVRITAYGDHPAGSRVLSEDTDNSMGVIALGTPEETLRLSDVLETDGFSREDGVYLTADMDRDVAGQGDVRIYGPEPGMPFGAFLGHGESEPQDTVRRLDRHLCWTDETETGVYAPGDPLYLSLTTQCTGNVSPGDLRLSNTTHGEAGTRVTATDSDNGTRYSVLPDARVAYVDVDGNGRRDRQDIVLLRIASPAENEIHAGDMFLTPTSRGPGAGIMNDDPLISTPTNDMGRLKNILVFKPSSGKTSLGAHDPIYISPDTSNGQGLSPNDIRLVAAPGRPFGGPTGLETGELLSEITRDSDASVCTTTEIGDDYLPGDPVYLRLDGKCPDRVRSGLLRLVPFDDHPAFSIVSGSDNDTARLLFTPEDTPQLRYYSAGSSTWGFSTRLYLNIIDPNEDEINVGDIRLTDAGPERSGGRAVLGSDADRVVTALTALGPLSDHTGYIDLDRDNTFGSSDQAYITPTTGHEHVTPLSVRLGPLADSFGPVPLPDPPARDDDPPTDDDATNGDDATDDDAMDDDGSQADADGEEEPTPAPAAAVLALLLMGLLAVRRRRHR